jgi:hypothetical protein
MHIQDEAKPMDENSYPPFTYREVGGTFVCTPDFEIPDPVLHRALTTLDMPTTASAILNLWPRPRSKRLSEEGVMVMIEGPLGMASGEGPNEVAAVAWALIDVQRDWAVMRDRQESDKAATHRFNVMIGLETEPLGVTHYNAAHDDIKSACDHMVEHIRSSFGTVSEQNAVHITRSRLNTILDVFYTDAVDAMKREIARG